MQLKNNNPVPMEKRTDLASLFCMIGRHGPAVAVAVIAVVAGFIIYRTVKGKRRKAEAGPGDVGGGSSSSSSSSGVLRDESLELELSPGREAHSPVESTDVSEEVANARDAPIIRSRRKLRNRRANAEKSLQSSPLPKREVEPEKLCNASHVEETSSINQTGAEEAVKNLQNDTYELTDLNVKDEACKCNLVETPRDADGDCSECLEPVVVCESLGNEGKVQRSKEDDVSTEMPCQEKENLCALNSPVYHVENASMSLIGNDEKHHDQCTTDSINAGTYSEEPSIELHESLPSTKNEDEISVRDIAGLNKPHLANKGSENVTLHKQMADQPMTSQTTPAICGEDADQSPYGEITENKRTNLGELSANSAVLQSSKELEQDASTCSKENVEDVKQSLLGEPQETSVVFSPVLQSLPVEQEALQNDQALTLVSLQPETKIKEKVTPELAKTRDALLDLGFACQSEVETANDIAILKDDESSADGDPNAVIGVEVSSNASVPEMSYPDSSFQNQENEIMQSTEDNLEVPTAPALVMTESIEFRIEDQLLYENPSNLTWCTPDVGEESGISSMTVSPDLPDAGECLASENGLLVVLDAHPQSEDQAELQTTMTDSQSVINKEPADSLSEFSNDSQPYKEDTDKPNDSSSVSEKCREIESFNRTVGQHAKEAPTGICLDEDLGKLGTKIIDGKCEVEGKEEDKTEINIMEATMDNNEWITDSIDKVLPWMKPSVHVPEINIVSDFETSFPADTACTNADVSPVNKSEEAPLSDEATETGRRVLAVQPLPQNVSVTFQIHYLTHSQYQKVAITGNHWVLGNWKDFVPLEKAKDGFWATVVSLPAESHVEWKFVIVDRGQVCRWEECGNRFLDTGKRENLLVHKCWGFL